MNNKKIENKTKKILLVDDNTEFRKTIKNYLEENGFNILEAETAKGGVEKAVSEKPDLILMDIRLPDMSGIDAARQIKSNSPLCKIILVTMFDSAMFRQVYDCRDLDGYIGKNEVYEKLLPCMENVLRNGHPSNIRKNKQTKECS